MAVSVNYMSFLGCPYMRDPNSLGSILCAPGFWKLSHDTVALFGTWHPNIDNYAGP